MSTSDEFLSNVDSGKMTSAYRSGWGPDYPSADNYLVQLYDSSSADGKDGNSGNYKNPEFDAMMDRLFPPRPPRKPTSISKVRRFCCRTFRLSRCGTRMPPQPAPPQSPASHSTTAAAQCSPH